MAKYVATLVVCLISLLTPDVLFADDDRQNLVIGTEDRVLSYDKRIGRLTRGGRGSLHCTATLISKSCAISAGHCTSVSRAIGFDIEPIPNGRSKATPENTFRILRNGTTAVDNGPGDDWAVFKIDKNRKTGKYPGETRGFYKLGKLRPSPDQRIINIGYGAADNAYSFFQQLGEGLITGTYVEGEHKNYFEHNADTGSASSGSAIFNQDMEIIGINTHGHLIKRINIGTVTGDHPELKEAISKCLETESDK